MRRLLYAALLVLVSIFAITPNSQAEVYLGDFCWQADSTVTPKSALLSIGVYKKEGGHIALFGKVFQENNTAIHGNAEIDGTSLVMTLIESGDINNFWPGTEALIWNVILARSGLNGTYSSLEVIPQQNIPEDTGTMTLITCP